MKKGWPTIRFWQVALLGAVAVAAPVAAAQLDATLDAVVDDFAPASAAVTSMPGGDEADTAPVTAEDLREAGFTDPVRLMPELNLYEPPVYYFRVLEAPTDGSAAWGEVANVVAVTVFAPELETALLAAPRRIEYAPLHGRFQAKFAKDGYYVVVTGPDEGKVASLAKIMEAKEY
jgi:hypothetical protein